MRKTTFYGLAVFCGLGSLFFGAVIVFGSGSCSSAKSMRVDADFCSIGSAIKLYKVNAGRPLSTAQGLDALINEPTTGPRPKRWTQIVTKMPLDPWGTPYRYTLLGPKDHEWRWELRSAGKDKVFGSPDDLAEETEMDPLATRETTEAESRPSF